MNRKLSIKAQKMYLLKEVKKNYMRIQDKRWK